MNEQQKKWLEGPFGKIVLSDPWHQYPIPTEEEERTLHGFQAIEPSGRAFVELQVLDGGCDFEFDEPLSKEEFSFMEEHIAVGFFEPVPGVSMWYQGDFYVAQYFLSTEQFEGFINKHKTYLPNWLAGCLDSTDPFEEYCQRWFKYASHITRIQMNKHWWQYRSKIMRNLARKDIVPYDSFLITESGTPELGLEFERQRRSL